MPKPFVLFATFLTVATAQQAPAPAPTPPLDRTGVAWCLPFAAAQARSKQEQRLLFVPVIAGGTDATGCW